MGRTLIERFRDYPLCKVPWWIREFLVAESIPAPFIGSKLTLKMHRTMIRGFVWPRQENDVGERVYLILTY